MVLCLPTLSSRISSKLFPKWGTFLNDMPAKELRRLGLIELSFGLLLGAYLVWAGKYPF